MILRILVCSLFALSTANALAGNIYIQKDQGGQVLVTNVNPHVNFDNSTKKVKVTHYRPSKKSKPNQTVILSSEEIQQAIDKLVEAKK